jgi:integrase
MNIQPFGPNRWRLYWQLGRDAQGRRRQKTRVVTGTRKDAERIWIAEAARLEREGPQGEVVTVADLGAAWLDDVRVRVRPTTLDSYQRVVARWVAACGERRLAAVRPGELQRIVNTWVETGTVPAASAAYAVKVLRMMWGQAVRWEWVPRNPALAVMPPTVTRRPAQWWDAATAARFIGATRAYRYWGAWTLVLLTGLRQGELLGLRWQDVDRSRRLLAIRQIRAHSGGTAFQATTKTAAGTRVIPYPAEAEAVFEWLADQQARDRQRAGPHWADLDLVVTTRLGQSPSPRSLLREFGAACRRVGVPPITFHALRHTHASLLRAAHADPRLMADRLGHTNPHFTVKTYVHADPDDQRPVADAVAAILLGPGEDR